ncbi:MAG TPA: hypothetical protein VN838_27275 [Bradyrhizobium sp.]|nr:hypothetical protein [Bradyrhizobium sp.]
MMLYDYITELWPVVAVAAVPAAFLASRKARSFAASWLVVFFAGLPLALYLFAFLLPQDFFERHFPSSHSLFGFFFMLMTYGGAMICLSFLTGTLAGMLILLLRRRIQDY